MNSVNSREALLMLDTDMEDDMKAYKEELTLLTIKHINSNRQVFDYVKGNLKHNLSVKDSATTWAKNHSNEFGPLFETELELVDWKKVTGAI